MPQTIIRNGSVNLEITPVALDVPILNSHLRELQVHLEQFHSTSHINKFLVKLTSAPMVYSYEFHSSGRMWKQLLQFDAEYGLDPTLTLNEISPGWKLSDSIMHRDIREHVLALINQFKFDELVVTW